MHAGHMIHTLPYIVGRIPISCIIIFIITCICQFKEQRPVKLTLHLNQGAGGAGGGHKKGGKERPETSPPPLSRSACREEGFVCRPQLRRLAV